MRKEMKTVLSLVLVGTILTGCAGSAGSKTAGGTDGDKAEGTEKPYDGVTITMMMNQGTYATTFSGVFLEICEEIEEKTGITMDVQPVTDFMDVIQVKLATNDIPDIFVHNLPQNVKIF